MGVFRFEPTKGDLSNVLIVTMILYLTSPEAGGTTFFQHAQKGKVSQLSLHGLLVYVGQCMTVCGLGVSLPASPWQLGCLVELLQQRHSRLPFRPFVRALAQRNQMECGTLLLRRCEEVRLIRARHDFSSKGCRQ